MNQIRIDRDLSGDIGGFHLLNNGSHHHIIDLVGFDVGSFEESFESISTQIVGLQIFVSGWIHIGKIEETFWKYLR